MKHLLVMLFLVSITNICFAQQVATVTNINKTPSNFNRVAPKKKIKKPEEKKAVKRISKVISNPVYQNKDKYTAPGVKRVVKKIGTTKPKTKKISVRKIVTKLN